MKPLPSEDLEHILVHTRSLWERVRGKSIFVSGGTGFFGVWLLESLVYCNRKLRLGLSATILTRDREALLKRMPELASEPSIELLQGDVRSFAFPNQDFDYVLHAAAPTTQHASIGSRGLMQTLVHGTERMVELAQARNARSFLNVSSGAVYGRQPENLSHIPETYLGGPDWLDPNAVYGEGKRISEQMCSLLAKESTRRVAIARCFTFIGPHLPLDQHFAIGNFIADALAGRNIVLRGDGTPTRSYLYMADLAIWLWTMLLFEDKPTTSPLVLNVGSGETISIRDLAQEVIDELGPTLKVEFANNATAGEQRLQYVPDVSRAQSELGLGPIVGLRDAIRRTGEWYR
jgi:nucleoside-diphosphate-sugar epimerase